MLFIVLLYKVFMKERFWNKWLNANELDRIKLVETLPIIKIMSVKNGSMLNSYFEDLLKEVNRK